MKRSRASRTRGTVLAAFVWFIAAAHHHAVFAQQAARGFGNGFGNFGLGTNSFGLSGLSSANSGANTNNGSNSSGGAGGTSAPLVSLGQNLGGFDSTFGASTFSSPTAAALTNLGGLGALGGRFGGLGGFGRFGGFGGFGGFGQRNGQQNQGPIRATIRLGFQYEPVPVAERSQEINSRLARLPLPAKYSDIEVYLDGRTATITGKVPSEEDAALLERLVELEPGIDQVLNQVEIASDDGQE
ncbi:MAG: hypothetical protein KatS3mg111_3562 [Pirellulaceae bacterium]|nr:MAG: hypothetical protein KatS3mg111_3562 [Pirellulaceae bacterium]